ncbi:filamentous hemagglutinin N-terminal domain-containing protein, partial [Pseudomonas sp. MWU16-30317]|uniref:two-partner secretion domain-containing protein n=1 Tax=Pseudomonas sp. MWU16-30317 TaxID=2878095 RepID=UPI001CFB5572
MDVRQLAFLARQPSAALQPRERFWGMPKRGLAVLLVNALFWQPLWAQAGGIAVSGQGTTLGAAGNGVPIVNIAAPNASGLSHNQFGDYNVGTQGVILNNATASTQSTQLGGIIVGNGNLKGKAASTILNEVTGTNRSQLNGYTEVAGQAAHVIVANPYGITCNGCGFINTPRATLTTGKPVLDASGRLDHYQVDGGDVAIEGAGINVGNIDGFEVITRSAHINAQINANQLSVIAGRNDVDATTLQATARADDGSAKPALAIDSTALGGMYAGAIKLVGTEQGVGVNLVGNLAASAGDIELDANGHLSVAQTAASGAVTVNAQSLTTQGPVYAGSHLDVSTTGDITNSQSLAARDSISLSSGGQLTNSGIIEAGVNADNSRNGSADLHISAQNLTNAGSVVANRDLTVQVTQAINNQGHGLSAKGNLTLTGQQLNNGQAGLISAGQALTANVDHIDNRSGELSTGGTLTVHGSGLDNSNGVITADGAATLSTGTLNNTQGQLTSTATLDLTAGQVINTGRIASNGALDASVSGLDQHGGKLFSASSLSLDLNGGHLDNSGGLINASTGLVLKNLADVVNRNGEISSHQAFALNASSLDNTGGKLISDQALTLYIAQALSNVTGVVSANGLDIASASLDNSNGQIASQRDIHTQVDALTNHNGEITAQSTLTLAGNSLDNSQNGWLGSAGTLSSSVASVNNQGGELSSQSDILLSGNQLDNSHSGQVLASQRLLSTVQRLLNNTQGLLSGHTSVSLNGTALDNSNGQVKTQGDLLLAFNGDLTNTQGLLSSEGLLTASAGSLANRLGSLSSAGQLSLTTLGAIDNEGGQLVTDGGLDLHSASLDNSHSGTVSASAAMSIHTGALDNHHAGSISGGDTLALSAGQVSNGDGGKLASQNAFTASVTGLDQPGGKLFSNSALTLDLNHGTLNNQSGLLTAPVLVLKNLAAVDNTGGEISSAQAFNLNADSLVNDNGKLLSNQALTVAVNHALSNLNGTIAAAALQVQAASLNNAGGTLSSQGDLAVTLSGALDNHNLGLIDAAGNLAINAAAIDNSAGGNLLGSAIALDFGAATGDLNNASGLITTTGQLTLQHLRDLNNQKGELSSSESVTLSARNVDNTNGQLISNNLLALTANSLLNPGGLVSGWQGVMVTAASLDNRNSGTVSSRYGDVTVSVQGDLLNGTNGALVSQGALSVNAANLDNSAGILSSGGGQSLSVANLLNNGQGGLIDSGAGLTLQAMSLSNTAGTINAQNAFGFTGTDFDNTRGSVATNGSGTLNLLGVLTNTSGKLATGADLLIQGATQVDNHNGQLVSQTLLTLLTGGFDNSQAGTLAANGTLNVTATGAVQNNANGLIYSQTADVNLHAANLANSQGTLQSQTALNLTVSGDIDNQSGTVLAQAGDLTVNAANLDSRGGTLASQQGAFTAQLTGALKNGYDLSNNSKKGNIQAQRLNLTSASLDNDGGRIAAQGGDAVISTGDFNNQNAGLYASGKVQVTAHDFDNSGAADGQIGGQQIDLSLSGALNNQTGIIESSGTLSVAAASINNANGKLRALGTRGTTLFNVSGLLDNSNGTLETANQDLTLNLGSFNNLNGSLLHVGTGTFAIAPANLANIGGSLVTNGSLTINADNWTNSSVIQAGDLTVNVNTLNQTASGQLLGSRQITGTGGNWSNDGLLASNGGLGLTLNGSYGGNGRLTSVGDLHLSAAQVNLPSAASIEGGANTTVNVSGQLSTAGRLTAGATLTVNAGGVDNEGTLGSGTGLIVTTGALVNNQGLIFSGGDMSLRVASLTNSYANIYSLGKLSLDRDGQGGLADSLMNSSGTIQSDGDMTLNVSALDNQRAVLVVNDAGKYTAEIVQVSCYKYLNNNTADCDGSKQNAVFEITERDKLEVTASSVASSISAGGNLNIVGGQVNNASSTISAGQNLYASADSLTNQGVVTGDTQNFRVFETERSEHRSGWANDATQFTQKYWIDSAGYDPSDLSGLDAALSDFIAHDTQKELTYLAQTTQLASSNQDYAAVIQAGGSVNITAANQINNSVTRVGYDYVGAGPRTNTDAAGSAFATHVSLNQQLPPDLAQKAVDPVSLPGFTLPTGQNGLFRLSGTGSSTASSSTASWSLGGTQLTTSQHQAATSAGQAPAVPVSGTTASTISGAQTPSASTTSIARVQGVPDTSAQSQPQKYLIETNPALTNLKQFMSSDYMLAALGYDPDTSAKRLGDGLYEQTLVDQAIVARTGARFIDGQTSDTAQFKYLMDNGIAAQQQLNLSVGTALSSEQVAALTHDIVWMQSEVVDGQTVLVPVLYLANANNRLAANGALIQGTDVNLIAGSDLSNAGTLKATGSLSAIAGNNLVNSGVVQADSRLDLLAGNNLTNTAGGIIAGRDVSLTAVDGDVSNERSITTHQSALGSATERTDLVDSAARVEAAGSLTINAGRDVNNTGGVLSSGTGTTITAGRDVNIVAAQAIDASTRTSKFTRSTTTQDSASVTAGGDLSITAGRDLAVTASQLAAGGNVALSATDNVSVSAAANEAHSYTASSHKKWQNDDVTQVASTVTAGGSVAVGAGQDLTLTSSNVTAGTDAYLYAGDKLQMLAAQDSSYSLYDMKKKGSFGSKKLQHDEVTQTTNVGSSVTTGGNLTLASNGDQLYQAAKLNSGNDLTVASGGAITFEGVKDLDQETHTKSSSNLAWTSAKGKGNTDETLQQTEMVARGKTVITAVNGLNIDVKQIDKQTVSQVIDTMVAADPKLAWLKDAEARGDVNWQQVKEVHDSFKYSSHGLGAGAEIILAIAMTLAMGPAGLGMGTVSAAGA